MSDAPTVTDTARGAAYAARYGPPVGTYTWEIVADAVLEAAAPYLAYAAGGAAGDRIRELETTIGVQTGRIGELERLAADILSRFTKGDGGHRARVGQVQIGKWQAVLDGGPDRG